MRQGRPHLWLTAGLVALLLLAPAAQAGTPGETVSLGRSHGLEYMQAKFPGVVTQAGAPANCDGDAEVTGGGGSINGPADTAQLNATYPLTAVGTGWQAEGTATSGAARKVTTYAVCGGVDVDYDSHTGSLDTNTVLHDFNTCPAGASPLDGGGRATGAGILIVGNSASLPPSTVGWSPTVYNMTGSDTLWESHAVCSDGYEVRYRSSPPTKMAPGESAKAVVPCKQNEAVLGGGFESVRQKAVGYRAYTVATKPWDSKDDSNKVPDDGWFARSLNTESLNVNVVAKATCLRP